MFLPKRDGVYYGKRNVFNLIKINTFDKTNCNTLISLESSEDNDMLMKINILNWENNLFTICDKATYESTNDIRSGINGFNQETLMFDPLKDYYNPLDMLAVRVRTNEIARIIIFSKMKNFNYSNLIEVTAVKWLKVMLDFLLDTSNEKYSIKDMTTLYQVVDDFWKGNIEEEFLISKDEKEFYQEQEKREGGNFRASVFALISLSLTEFRDRLLKKENAENHFSLENSFITRNFFEKRKSFYFMIEKEDIERFKILINLMIFDFYVNFRMTKNDKMLYIFNSEISNGKLLVDYTILQDIKEKFKIENNKFLIFQNNINDFEEKHVFFDKILKYNKETKKNMLIEKNNSDKLVKIIELERI